MTDSEKPDLILAGFDQTDQRLDQMDKNITDIKLTLENETHVNIVENELRRIKERLGQIA